MHELAVCQSLLSQVEGVAEQHRRSPSAPAPVVVRIAVAIGPLSGVEAALLTAAFTIARCGTAASAAVLEVENSEIRVRCTACGEVSPAQSTRLVCGVCGDWRTHLLSGDELILKSVELEEATCV